MIIYFIVVNILGDFLNRINLNNVVNIIDVYVKMEIFFVGVKL